MKNKIIIILVTISIILLVWFYFTHADFSPKKDNNELLLDKINKLELKLDSITDKKDSIRIVIDSTHVKIITNEKHYQEVVNTILSQPSVSDYEYIRQYIRFHRSQRDSVDLCRESEIIN